MTTISVISSLSDLFPVISASFLGTLDTNSLFELGNTIAYYKNSCAPALECIEANTPIPGGVLDEISRNMGSYQNYTGHTCEAPVDNNTITQFSAVMEENKNTIGTEIFRNRTPR